MDNQSKNSQEKPTRKLRGNKRRVKAYIGLGSNEGDRLGNVQQAVSLLKDVPGITLIETSSIYETEPSGDQWGKWFVNAVVCVEVELSPFVLLEVCKDIEKRLIETHVKARGKSGNLERVMDLDILFFGEEVLCEKDLIVPHPRLLKRAFALVPLLEIAPEIRYPGLSKSVAALHEELSEPEQVFLYGTRESEKE